MTGHTSQNSGRSRADGLPSAGVTVAIIGLVMFGIGLALFYSIDTGQANETMRMIKNAGTFVGISGMGVIMAGVLLYFISKSEPPISDAWA